MHSEFSKIIFSLNSSLYSCHICTCFLCNNFLLSHHLCKELFHTQVILEKKIFYFVHSLCWTCKNAHSRSTIIFNSAFFHCNFTRTPNCHNNVNFWQIYDMPWNVARQRQCSCQHEDKNNEYNENYKKWTYDLLPWVWMSSIFAERCKKYAKKARAKVKRD